MPKLLRARPPRDDQEGRQVRKLAGSRHAPGDWIRRARMVARSWDGLRTSAIAGELGCHQETVRERLTRFNAEGLDGLGDRPGAGRKPRLTEAERGTLVALARSTPPGRPIQWPDGTLTPVDERPEAPAEWTLDSLVAAAAERGVVIKRSQVRRILLKERVRWRRSRSWITSTDPDFAPKGPGSSASTRTRRPMPP
ncbi:MAG TPA: helix-turn-helix domain-containing protein [Streptomyces sp.]|nr:helix-turn-helix domain-containing protein [Streptomyces sp.]